MNTKSNNAASMPSALIRMIQRTNRCQISLTGDIYENAQVVIIMTRKYLVGFSQAESDNIASCIRSGSDEYVGKWVMAEHDYEQGLV